MIIPARSPSCPRSLSKFVGVCLRFSGFAGFPGNPRPRSAREAPTTAILGCSDNGDTTPVLPGSPVSSPGERVNSSLPSTLRPRLSSYLLPFTVRPLNSPETRSSPFATLLFGLPPASRPPPPTRLTTSFPAFSTSRGSIGGSRRPVKATKGETVVDRHHPRRPNIETRLPSRLRRKLARLRRLRSYKKQYRFPQTTALSVKKTPRLEPAASRRFPASTAVQHRPRSRGKRPLPTTLPPPEWSRRRDAPCGKQGNSISDLAAVGHLRCDSNRLPSSIAPRCAGEVVRISLDASRD